MFDRMLSDRVGAFAERARLKLIQLFIAGVCLGIALGLMLGMVVK